MRGGIAIDNIVALLHDVAVLKMDVLALGDQIFNRLRTFFVRHDRNPGLVFVVTTKLHRARSFRNDRVILRTARLEQFRDPRQTAGNVARFSGFHRDTRDNITRLDRTARIDADDRIDGKRIARVAATLQFTYLAIGGLDHDRRLQSCGTLAEPPIDDHAFGNTRRLVDGLGHRRAFDEILEADRAVDLRQDRPRIRVPLGNALAPLDLVAFIDSQSRAILDAMHRAFDTIRPLDDHGNIARHDHEIAFGISREMPVADLHGPLEIRFDEGLIRDLRRAADMEGAHRELRAGFTDRLRRDDADRFTHIDRSSSGEIAAIALRADAILRLAGENRADLHLLDAGRIDAINMRLLDHFTRVDDGRAVGISQLFRSRTAENARCQRGHNVARIDDRPHTDTILGTAIDRRDDRILSDVNETAGEIAGVGRLQGCIGKALTRTMGRVEILEHGEAFLEVRDNRAFNDLAGGLGHQPTHRGKLLHLGWRTTRARMRHHVNRIDRLVAAVIILLNGRDAAHHFFGKLVRTFRPGIDNLVIFLALGDQTVIILLLIFLGERSRLLDDARLRLGHDHVILAEGDARLEGLAEAQGHDPVAENDRLLLPAIAVDDVDHVRDLFLRHELVHDVKGDLVVPRQKLAKDQAARRSIENFRYPLTIRIIGPGAALDLGVQGDCLGMQGMFDLAHIGEHHALPRLAVTHQRNIIKAEHDIL